MTEPAKDLDALARDVRIYVFREASSGTKSTSIGGARRAIYPAAPS